MKCAVIASASLLLAGTAPQVAPAPTVPWDPGTAKISITNLNEARAKAMVVKQSLPATPKNLSRPMEDQAAKEIASIRATAERDQDIDTFTASKVAVKVTQVKTSNGNAEVKYRIDTVLNRSAAAVSEGAPATMEAATDRTARFAAENGRWVLTEDEVQGQEVRTRSVTEEPAQAGMEDVIEAAAAGPSATTGPLATPSDDVRDAEVGATPSEDAQRMSPRAAAAYFNRSKGVEYARKYAKSHNSSYHTFDNDCTNFISQIMRHGGWSMHGSNRTSTKDWYYKWGVTARPSHSWTWAQKFHEYARGGSNRVVAKGKLTSLSVGDVVQGDLAGKGEINHSMFITKKDSKGELYLTYHTSDTVDRPFSAIRRQYPNAKWYFQGPK